MGKTLAKAVIILVWLSLFTVAAHARMPSIPGNASGAGFESYKTRILAHNSVPKISPKVLQMLALQQEDELVPVIVTFNIQADLTSIDLTDPSGRQKRVIDALQSVSALTKSSMRSFLEDRQRQGLISKLEYFWVFNGLALTATQGVIEEMAARPEVLKITPNELIPGPSPLTATDAPAETNIALINAPTLWDMGFRGEGIVVANMDTGVSWEHPDLSAQWRGGSNSWFDPYGQHPFLPSDVNGHGTWTMGVMVGRDSGGTAIGVAPNAQWIAAKIFDDAGNATTQGIHQAFQWMLDPDGNPSTPDAPDVVNNSWSYQTPGCNLEFRLDVQALRAANILPLFAAGNSGPGASSSVSPPNYPESLAVGATNNTDQIYFFSSRGPSSCGESSTNFPEIVAPGVGIRTSDLFGFYFNPTGTSLAAPHAAGGLALLLQAFPNLPVAYQESALMLSAIDLGSAGADNTFGYGRLDLYSAYQWIQGNVSQPTPTGSPTSTSGFPTESETPMATSTATPTNTLVSPSPTSTPTPTIGGNTNFALNNPVLVSSFHNSSSTGEMAVDGVVNTYWRSKRADYPNPPASEWISVDLGGILTVNRVVLHWNSHYARSYTIQLSQDNSNWITIYSTASGDGGEDMVDFGSIPARYVKMDSTSWRSALNRVWLNELEVYGNGGTPPSSSTPTATSTNTPTRTGTPTGTSTVTPSATTTATTTPTLVLTNTPTSTSQPALTDTSTPTNTSPATAEATASPTPTASSLPTFTSTATATIAALPTDTATPTPPPSSDLIFADGWESGNFSTWSNEVDTEGDLNVSTGAALFGSFGMAALIDNNTGMYLQDFSPVSESRYRARFYFDPNGITMSNGAFQTIFMGATSTGQAVVRINLHWQGGNYRVRAVAQSDTGANNATPFTTISDAPHSLEIDWEAASASGTNNGSVSFWIDGIHVATVAGIDNDAMRVDQAWLGPIIGNFSGTSGSEFFDAFESRRLNYIGP